MTKDPLTIVQERLSAAALVLNCNADQVRNSLQHHQDLVNAARKVVNALDQNMECGELKQAIGELAYCLPPEVSVT